MLPLTKQHIVPCLQTGDYSRRGQQGASNHWATKVAGARQRVKHCPSLPLLSSGPTFSISNVHVPTGCSPQKCTDMNGQSWKSRSCLSFLRFCSKVVLVPFGDTKKICRSPRRWYCRLILAWTCSTYRTSFIVSRQPSVVASTTSRELEIFLKSIITYYIKENKIVSNSVASALNKSIFRWRIISIALYRWVSARKT